MKAILLLILAILPGKGLQHICHRDAGLSDRCIGELDSTICLAIADTVFPGAVLTIVRGDRIAYSKAFGAKAVEPMYEPLREDDIFDLASLSKPVSTAVAAFQLIERGDLDPEDPVEKYIPGFEPYRGRVGKGRDARTETVPIRVRDLLLHSSGLPSYIAVDDFLSTHDSTRQAMMEYIFKEAPRKNRPGTKRRYSCLNFITLQEIIERITSDSLCNYSKNNIFDVLGMDDTQYFPGGAPAMLLPRIVPTERGADSLFIRGHVHDPLAWKFGGGNSGNAGVFSTAGDIAVLCAALLNGGALYRQEDGSMSAEKSGRECRILDPSSVKAMSRVDKTTGRTPGWDSASPSASFAGELFASGRMVCHTGFTGPSIVIDFNSGTAIILMCSRLHPSDRSLASWEHALLGDVRTAVSEIVARDVCVAR